MFTRFLDATLASHRLIGSKSSLLLLADSGAQSIDLTQATAESTPKEATIVLVESCDADLSAPLATLKTLQPSRIVLVSLCVCTEPKKELSVAEKAVSDSGLPFSIIRASSGVETADLELGAKQGVKVTSLGTLSLASVPASKQQLAEVVAAVISASDSTSLEVGSDAATAVAPIASVVTSFIQPPVDRECSQPESNHNAFSIHLAYSDTAITNFSPLCSFKGRIRSQGCS